MCRGAASPLPSRCLSCGHSQCVRGLGVVQDLVCRQYQRWGSAAREFAAPPIIDERNVSGQARFSCG